MSHIRRQQLSKYFEEHLQRPLNEKEQFFVKWLAKKEAAERKKLTDSE